jgi:hypothetical protein
MAVAPHEQIGVLSRANLCDRRQQNDGIVGVVTIDGQHHIAGLQAGPRRRSE